MSLLCTPSSRDIPCVTLRLLAIILLIFWTTVVYNTILIGVLPERGDALETKLSATNYHIATAPSRIFIRSDLSEKEPLLIWDIILQASSVAAIESQKTPNPLVAIEVGVHTPKHCIQAATLGYTTHCFEPSPKSYARLESGVEGIVDNEVKSRLMPYRYAASDTTGIMIPFRSTGGTGDHVGEYDMWRMERRAKSPENESVIDREKRGEIIEVPTIRLDNFVTNDLMGARSQEHRLSPSEVYLLKVDTQGYEPSIFAGLANTLKAGAVKYMIFEFWPRGMDLMAGTGNSCSAGTGVLNTLVEAGYILYALGVASHPKAPLGGTNLRKEGRTRPMDIITTADAYCQWFLDVEGRHPSSPGGDEYRFGYWSDFLAVAPGTELPVDLLQGRYWLRWLFSALST